MSAIEGNIDAIVREVLRRLAQPTAPAPPIVSSAIAPPAAPSGGELTLDAHVISLAVLRDRLAGIRSLSVPRRAIITPAARDELKLRGIAVRRREASAIAPPQPTNLIIARGDTVRILAAIQAAGGKATLVNVANLSPTSLQSIAHDLT